MASLELKCRSCIEKCSFSIDLDRLECLSVLISFYSNLATNALEDMLADHLMESFEFAWLERFAEIGYARQIGCRTSRGKDAFISGLNAKL